MARYNSLEHRGVYEWLALYLINLSISLPTYTCVQLYVAVEGGIVAAVYLIHI